MFAKDIRILVVDDMLTMRKIIKKNLVELGYINIAEGKDGSDALEKVKEKANAGKKFDLIISDWNMPNMMGLEFLKSFRVLPGQAQTPFIMVTAESENDQVLDAIKAGVTEYLTKPFTRDALEQKLGSSYKKALAES